MAPLTVLIPVNRLDRAKGRLAGLLTPGERAEVARRSLRTVLEAVAEASLEAVVLTADGAVRAAVAGERVRRVLLEEPQLQGLSEQLEGALGRLGVEEALILHADLPLATPEALQAFVAEAPPAPSVALVRSGDGGTNAMLVRPPGRFALRYGRGSGDLHEAGAREAGLAVRRVESPELALDLDTPEDVRRLLASEEGWGCAVGQYLVEIGVDGRLAEGD